jgi:hypothetical protein
MSGAARRTQITRRKALPLAHGEACLLEFDGALVLRIVMGEIDGKPLIGADLFCDADTPAQLRGIAARIEVWRAQIGAAA